MQAAKASSFLWAGNIWLPRQGGDDGTLTSEQVTQIQHVDLFACVHLEHEAQYAFFFPRGEKTRTRGFQCDVWLRWQWP
jgi:hypothetical protein